MTNLYSDTEIEMRREIERLRGVVRRLNARSEITEITIKRSLGTLTLTPHELECEMDDLDFLRQALLVVINPEVCKNSDISYSYSDVIKFAVTMYKTGNSYCNDFIDKVFSGVPDPSESIHPGGCQNKSAGQR